MALFVRVTLEALEPVKAEWQQIVAFMSLASMILGAFAAIGQRNIKRLMAYSSIGHMGFALVGLARRLGSGRLRHPDLPCDLSGNDGRRLAVILSMRRDGVMTEDIDSLAGLSRTNPVVAYLLGIIMFSLAGIPPSPASSASISYLPPPSMPASTGSR